jgi:tetratricopeptide (TPR) repeat protein
MTDIRRCLSCIFVLLICYAGLADASTDDLEEGKRLFAARDFAAAKAIFEALQSEDPEDPSVNYYLAKSYVKERNYRSALEYLQKSLEVDNTRPDTQYLLGITYISLLNDVNVFKKVSYAGKTKKAWRTALELDGNHLQSRFALTSFYMNAPGIAGGDMGEAKRQIEILLRLHEGYGTLATAIFLEKSDRITEAEEYFASAVGKIDDRAGPLFNLANFYVRQERYNEALAKLQAYVASDSKSWDDPDDLFVYWLRAVIMTGLGDTSSAKKEFEQALTLNPSDSMRKEILNRMDSL